MIFYSVNFFSFFTLFFLLYWLVLKNHLNLQNLLLLISSYIFYGWTDWRFLLYLIGISFLNFYLGIFIEKKPKNKRLLLYIGLIQGIGSLAFFKYFNFFVSSFNSVFKLLHVNFSIHTLNIIIPLGISFFTFRTLSYLLDIEKGKIKPTTDLVTFFIYVSFFPTLLSGPIDKAKTFIPQLEKPRVFDYKQAAEGLRQIAWGIFKKVVIADNCVAITDQIFDHYSVLKGSTLFIGACLYTIEIYSDFSGYSDMAIGISRLIGFKITKNFDFPLYAQNISEFWRKWHISLTSWITEYVFSPLSILFRDYNNLGLIAAILINFTIIGFWHGDKWTYVLYGFLNGCFFIPIILKGTMNKKKKIEKGKLLPSLGEGIRIAGTFTLVALTIIIFRSETILQAFHYYSHLFSFSLFSLPTIPSGNPTLIFVFLMLIIEWLQRDKEYGLQIDTIKRPIVRWSIYYGLIFAIILFGVSTENQFIYFKF